MTTYHQNTKDEAFNTFHWMSSQLLHQQRLLEKGNTGIYCPKNMALSPEEIVLRETAANYKGRAYCEL